MERKIIIHHIIFSVFLLSCQTKTPPPQETISLEKDSLRVLEMGRAAEWAINHNSMDTVLLDYVRSEDAFFILNGYKMEGFEKIIEAFQKDRRGLKIQITEDKVLIYPDLGIHMASFDQHVITPEGDTIPSKGVWTSFYRKVDGAWKLQGVHESLHKVKK